MANDDVFLTRSAERAAEVEGLASQLAGRVGVEGVLADLNRSARRARVPGLAVRGFRWDRYDQRTLRWWPQGITSSADHAEDEQVERRSVIVTSAYSHEVDGLHKGARLTFVDLSTLRYRHVLLVEPFVSDAEPDIGRVDVRPVRIHAGGIVWHGPWMHVGGTARGLYTFRLDDIIRVPTPGDRNQLGFRADGGFDGFGYRYVLPLRLTYDAHAATGHQNLRHSFLSLDRSERPAHLVIGEYGRGQMTTRLARFEIDPSTSLLRSAQDGVVKPVSLSGDGVPGMQGATVVNGQWYVTTSAGRRGRGSVWTGRPGALARTPGALPAGPEDITYWPSTDQLWSLTEYPGRRWVLALDRTRLG